VPPAPVVIRTGLPAASSTGMTWPVASSRSSSMTQPDSPGSVLSNTPSPSRSSNFTPSMDVFWNSPMFWNSRWVTRVTSS
jgi:hypothetical protein